MSIKNLDSLNEHDINSTDSSTSLDRRNFLKSMGLLSASGVVQSMSLNLATMNQAVASEIGTDDYKALVCVFLLGGNDHANTLIPIDNTNYESYQAHRVDIALSRSEALPLTPLNRLDRDTQYGLHPQLTGLHKLFHQQELAVLQNVGTLIEPVTLSDYQAKKVRLPPKLFSHNDQQAYWQNSSPEFKKSDGWGANIAEIKVLENQQPFFSCVNLKNRSVFLTSETLNQFNISDSGVIPVRGIKEGSTLYGSTQIPDLVREMMTRPRFNIFEQQISDTFGQLLFSEEAVSNAFKQVGTVETYFATDALSSQLKVVARMIKARQQLGVKRQVFMVGIGGFDTHDDLLGRHNKLMSDVNAGLTSFYQATKDLGVSNQVTTFTMSDFGRTFSSNGDGSDHGWGGHHFIMGGAVKGQTIYGQTPIYGTNTVSDVGRGRLIPTTSVDQYASTLAKWFGVPDEKLPLVAPNIANFSSRDIGFL